MTADVLSYQLLVVLVALVGGIWPALFAALLSGLTLDYFFVDPLYTITIGEPLHLLALVLYVVIAALVSLVVDQAARRSRARHGAPPPRRSCSRPSPAASSAARMRCRRSSPAPARRSA